MKNEKAIKKLAREELEYRVRLLENEARWRAQAESALQEREERLQIIFERAPVGFFIFKKGGVFIDGNRTLEIMSGYNRKELIGSNFTKIGLLPRDQVQKAVKLLNQVTNGIRIEPTEFTLIRKDGSRLDVTVHAYPVRIKDNSVIFGIARDISKRKKAEEKLRESEERYRLLFENVFDVIYSFDKEFQLLNVSPSVEKILGYKPEELIGKPFTELNILTPESLELAISHTLKAFAGDAVATEVFEFVTKEGAIRFGEVSINPQFKNGQVVSVICVGRDITDRARSQPECR